MTLTKTDQVALETGNYAYLNEKGAKAYTAEDYETAVEYYRLAASMGCVQSISNLGYCYMYGRSIPKNMELALAYFLLAASHDDVDALYKLGNIYGNGADGIEADTELSLYYYRKAICIVKQNFESEYQYPSLYFSVAKEMMPNGKMVCDLSTAYSYLQTAKKGYEIEKTGGVHYHKDALAQVLKALDDPCFEEVRTLYAEKYDESEDD